MYTYTLIDHQVLTCMFLPNSRMNPAIASARMQMPLQKSMMKKCSRKRASI